MVAWRQAGAGGAGTAAQAAEVAQAVTVALAEQWGACSRHHSTKNRTKYIE